MKPGKIQVGQHVFILRPQELWVSREKRHVTEIKQIAGIVRADLGGGFFEVAYYGPPGHFTRKRDLKANRGFMVYRERVSKDYLIRRNPEIDDPLEFR